MMPTAFPSAEADGLAADAPGDPGLDALTRAAAGLFAASASLVLLREGGRHRVVSAAGPAAATALGVAAAHWGGFDADGPLVVEDMAADPRFAGHPLVADPPGLRCCAATPLRGRDGQALGTLCILGTAPRRLRGEELPLLRDLSQAVTVVLELRRDRLRLREHEQRRRYIDALSRHLTWTATADGRLEDAAPGVLDLPGDAGGALPGRWSARVHPADRTRLARRWSRAVRDGDAFEEEYRLRVAEGGYRWFRSRAVSLRGADGGVLRWYGTLEDVHECRASREHAEYLARHDQLTGLPNHGSFREALERDIAAAGRGTAFALLRLDLDNFRAVNDTLGHAGGDAVLRQVADRLRACAREDDLVARLGGDEFLILQGGLQQSMGAALLAERVLRVLAEPVQVGGQRFELGASIGIATCPRDGAQVDALLRNAALAMDRAKSEGCGTYRFFDPAMDEALRRQQRLRADLRGALERGELGLHFQPILDARSERVETLEALLRWQHPVRGNVSPAEFVPAAEAAGLIAAIGRWVLRQACREAAGWPEHVRVAVNLSAVQFRGADLLSSVAEALSAADLAPARLELEITESVPLLDSAANLATLQQLRDLGVRIALDDFGTGYASLAYLQRFRFDQLKIDRSFVKRATEGGEALTIVRAVVGMARALGIATTAEGVETREQLDLLRTEQCDRVQGYLFSTPISAAAVPPLLRVLEGRRRGRDARATRPRLELVEEAGEWGGPTYDYRGARIWTNATGDSWQLWIDEHPLRGVSLPRIDRAMRLADAWFDGRSIPPP